MFWGFLIGLTGLSLSHAGGAESLCLTIVLHRVIDFPAGLPIFDFLPVACGFRLITPGAGSSRDLLCDSHVLVLPGFKSHFPFHAKKMQVICFQLRGHWGKSAWCGSTGPLAGVRVGEAKVPGPDARQAGQVDIRSFLCPQHLAVSEQETSQAHPRECHLIRVGVSNPTSILHKDAECAQIEADLLFLSETSAVRQTQRIMTHAVGSHSTGSLRAASSVLSSERLQTFLSPMSLSWPVPPALATSCSPYWLSVAEAC